MGAGASAANVEKSEFTIVLKKLPETIEEVVYVHERFPVIIDPTRKARMFLQYQAGTFLLAEELNQERLNRALVGALKFGRSVTISFESLRGLTYDFFSPGYFPKEVISRSEIFRSEVWSSVLKPQLGDDSADDFQPSADFVFILCATEDYIPPELASSMSVIRVVEAETSAATEVSTVDEEEVASLFGAAEVIRNSLALVEAGFDGDMEEIQAQLNKGYHIESVDGRKHTALSEAACQGHTEVISALLHLGADPNSASDTGRTPLWRAAFNGHAAVVSQLLEGGADPDAKDKVSMESCFDVASTDERDWDPARTILLKEQRRAKIQKELQERLKTAAEREEFAKSELRRELIGYAEKGDVEQIKRLLTEIAEEAEQSKLKPRVTAECRNAQGQSLLSIAAQKNDAAMVEFLLTHWKTCDKDRWDLREGEISATAKTFKTNPNSRDLKGWTCVAIAVFHDAAKALSLLLQHGGDPTIKSSYNRNAWDLAKDELDAANNIVRSRAEIRQVLIDHDTSSSKGGQLFAKKSMSNANGCDMYDGLDKDGSPIVMQVEMRTEDAAADSNTKGNKKKGKGNKASANKKTATSGAKKK